MNQFTNSGWMEQCDAAAKTARIRAVTVLAIGVFTAACSAPAGDDPATGEYGQARQGLFMEDDVSDWSENDLNVPICWTGEPGFAQEKAWSQAAIDATWGTV